AQYHDLGGHDFRWPGEHREPTRHGDFLRTVRGVGDHAAGDRAAEVLAPELLAIGGIERVEVAAYIAKEHDASRRRGHTAENRIIRLQAPLPEDGVGIDRIDPSSPVPLGSAFFAEHVERVPGRHSGPWLSDRN